MHPRVSPSLPVIGELMYFTVKGAPKWPEYKDSASNIVFNSNRTYVEKDDYRKEQLEFWKTIWHEVGC